MNKNDYKSIILDGEIGQGELFGGSIDWTAFEIRNPKDLVTMNGSKYDGENPTEIMDSTSQNYDANNPTHVNTAITKAEIIRLSQAKQLYTNAKDAEAKKIVYEQYFDVEAMTCYLIVSNVLYNYDGFWKNWIWTIYNGVSAPSFYDLDSIFGRAWYGTEVVEGSSTTGFLGIASYPSSPVITLYKDKADATYKKLRDANIISVENIMRYVNDWVNRVGVDAYKKNIKKWTSIPSYRASKNMDDNTQEGGFFDSPKRIELWLTERINFLDTYFNYSK